MRKTRRARQKVRSVRRRVSALLANSALLIASVLLSLAILDFAIKSMHLVSDQFGEWDDRLWIHHVKNKTGFYVNDDGLPIPVRFNSDGFRGPEFGPKQPGTYRILMLGDSFVASLGTRENETSSAYLERFLNQDRAIQDAGIHVEVYNLGVSGYSFLTYDLLLNDTIEKFEPDLAIINPFLGNDVLQDNLATDTKGYPHVAIRNAPDAAAPTLVSLPMHKPFIYTWNERMGWLFPSLQRFLFLRAQVALKTWQGSKQRIPTATDPVNLYLKNQSETFQESYRIIGMILERSEETARGHQAKLIVVPLTQAEQLYAPWREGFLRPYQNVSAQMLDFEKPDKDLLAQCALHGIACHPTLAQIRQAVLAQNRSTIFPHDSHYAQAGNEMHARIIAAYLQEQRLILGAEKDPSSS